MNKLKHLFLFATTMTTLAASAQWTEVEWAETDDIYIMDFLNDEVGYSYVHGLQSFFSTLKKTEDSGLTWTEISLPGQTVDFQAMDFYGEGEGVIVIRDWESSETITKVFQTENDGETWEDISPDVTPAGFGNAAVQFLDANTGFFVTAENFYATQNGGETWTETLLSAAALSVHFSDVNHGIIGTWDTSFLYQGGMLCTTNGGQDWNELMLEDAQTVIGDVHQFNETTAYAAPSKWGASGQQQFYKTTNNGQDWTTVPVPETEDNAGLSGFDFLTEDYGVITLSSNDNFYIYETTNGGDSWELQNQWGQFYIGAIKLTENSGYLAGSPGKLYRLNAPLAINELNRETINLFPNPAQSGQTIQWQSEVEFSSIRIVDITGKSVFQQRLSAQQAILPSLNKGIYFATLENAKSFSVVKVVVD